MLRLEKLETAYDASQVLFGIDPHVMPGEAVTLLGRDGMGKTTAARSIVGLTRARAGAISFAAGGSSARPPTASRGPA